MSQRPALAACVAAIAAIAIAASVPTKAASAAEAETTPFRIAGSDSMLPFLELLGREQAKHRPGFELEVSGRGSTTGPPLLLRGQAELASMTRALNATESAAFQASRRATGGRPWRSQLPSTRWPSTSTSPTP